MATRGLNRVQIIGNLGRDPEMRYTPAGKAVTNFTVAVGRVTRDPNGDTHEETEWFRVVAWDRLAETCQQYLKKGSKVYIEGRLQTRKYTDREGAERTSVEVVANDMMMLDSRRLDAVPAGSATREADGGDGQLDVDDDMPF
jgi:single-strand DNA-binding protein